MRAATWRALVVDDNAINLEVAVSRLQQLGLQADSADGGEQAVALALSVAYDLIVMDVQMPVVDGITATRRIRQALGLRPPIVALTANADDNDRKACLAAGMNDYLTKPLQEAHLQRVLQRWLPGWSPSGAGSAPSPASAHSPTGRPGATEPDADSEGLRERLAAVAGLDLAGSLGNLGGRLPSLERVLRRFATSYRAGEPALALAASQGDAAALWQTCHALRGACAVMCATALVQRIEALEAVLHAQQPSAAWQDPVQQLHTELVDLARQLAEALALV